MNFLLNKFKLNDDRSKKELKQYNLKNFDKFIIPISEGPEDLKYYYFMSIILDLVSKRPRKWKELPNNF